mgnify:FL=1
MVRLIKQLEVSMLKRRIKMCLAVIAVIAVSASISVYVFILVMS